jgi:hypothetical protein
VKECRPGADLREMSAQQRLEDATVVGDLQMEQFVRDHFRAEVCGLRN